jgi:hypothetical protein
MRLSECRGDAMDDYRSEIKRTSVDVFKSDIGIFEGNTFDRRIQDFENKAITRRNKSEEKSVELVLNVGMETAFLGLSISVATKSINGKFSILL